MSQIFTILAFLSLKKYVINTDLFEDGYVVALIISETDNEILIKCDGTYPIVLLKSRINAFIDVSNFSDDKLKCLLGKEEEFISINKDKVKYTGYSI